MYPQEEEDGGAWLHLLRRSLPAHQAGWVHGIDFFTEQCISIDYRTQKVWRCGDGQERKEQEPQLALAALWLLLLAQLACYAGGHRRAGPCAQALLILGLWLYVALAWRGGA